MFSGVVLEILRDGADNLPERLSLEQIGSLAQVMIQQRFPDIAVRPEVHSPDQTKGNLGTIPLFPNHRGARALREAAEQKEAARREAEQKEAERREAERREAEQKEAARREAEQKEAARREAEQKEAARREAEQKEAERREAEREEAARRETEQKEATHREAARRAERREAARREAEEALSRDPDRLLLEDWLGRKVAEQRQQLSEAATRLNEIEILGSDLDSKLRETYSSIRETRRSGGYLGALYEAKRVYQQQIRALEKAHDAIAVDIVCIKLSITLYKQAGSAWWGRLTGILSSERSSGSPLSFSRALADLVEQHVAVARVLEKRRIDRSRTIQPLLWILGIRVTPIIALLLLFALGVLLCLAWGSQTLFGFTFLPATTYEAVFLGYSQIGGRVAGAICLLLDFAVGVLACFPLVRTLRDVGGFLYPDSSSVSSKTLPYWRSAGLIAWTWLTTCYLLAPIYACYAWGYQLVIWGAPKAPSGVLEQVAIYLSAPLFLGLVFVLCFSAWELLKPAPKAIREARKRFFE
jgi:hypothetical protein